MIKTIRELLFFGLLILLKVQCEQQRIIRQTQNGPVEGLEQISVLNQRYYSFRGIPYAEPPITGIDPYTGERIDLRFKVRCDSNDALFYINRSTRLNIVDLNLQAPETLKRNWSVPLKVHDYRPLCITSGYPDSSKRTSYSEDCLFLNIFVPGMP